MDTCKEHHHHHHDHQHGSGCGHLAINHAGHTDYLHDGHLHHIHGAHVDEHVLEINAANLAQCTPEYICAGHDRSHVYSPAYVHQQVPHGDQSDFHGLLAVQA